MAGETLTTRRCLVCGRGSDVAPLLALEYKGAPYSICTQHLPVLIHDPGALAGKLPDAEKLAPADHHD